MSPLQECINLSLYYTLHLVCILVTSNVPKREKKLYQLVFLPKAWTFSCSFLLFSFAFLIPKLRVKTWENIKNARKNQKRKWNNAKCNKASRGHMSCSVLPEHYLTLIPQLAEGTNRHCTHPANQTPVAQCVLQWESPGEHLGGEWQASSMRGLWEESDITKALKGPEDAQGRPEGHAYSTAT